ncbi:MAG: hypothetical protein IT494_01365 [Gammaproteobacteria bacterium]|nr:hypothetical protein [Gammaproteobacteria bacterium]
MTILALAVSVPSIGQVSEAFARSPADCLAMGKVRKHVVVDDATILYVLKDGSMYVNLLNESCPGLKEFGLPLYEPGGGRFYQTARICAGNNLLVNRGPNVFLSPDSIVPSVSIQCPLGRFIPVSAAQAEKIRKPATRRSSSVAPVLPSIDDEENADRSHP